jgi:protocatechuate 3,4-dioxygenase beta subunit
MMGNLPGKFFRQNRIGILTAVALITMTIGLSFVGTIHSTPFGTPARLIELSGTVRDTQGRPVAALKVSLMNWFGESFGSAVTDDQGSFDIRDVAPGSYYARFRPLAENSAGQVMIIYVPSRAIHMHMTVTRNPSALACAQNPARIIG